MSSEAFQRKAQAINDASTLITRLDNLRSAIRDYERLRMDGAPLLSPDDETYHQYMADLDGIRSMATGPAGDAVRSEMKESEALDRLCDSERAEPDENELRTVDGAAARALARAQENLQKLLLGD